jgi:hypothetical protein
MSALHGLLFPSPSYCNFHAAAVQKEHAAVIASHEKDQVKIAETMFQEAKHVLLKRATVLTEQEFAALVEYVKKQNGCTAPTLANILIHSSTNGVSLKGSRSFLTSVQAYDLWQVLRQSNAVAASKDKMWQFAHVFATCCLCPWSLANVDEFGHIVRQYYPQYSHRVTGSITDDAALRTQLEATWTNVQQLAFVDFKPTLATAVSAGECCVCMEHVFFLLNNKAHFNCIRCSCLLHIPCIIAMMKAANTTKLVCPLCRHTH